MQAPNSSTISLLIFLPLIGWRIYSRFRRMVGRQRLSSVRPWVTLVLFPALVFLLCYLVRNDSARLLWLGGGLIVGTALGKFGLGKTQFEATEEGLFYTPNAHLGIALSLLFVGRILYRLIDVAVLHPDGPANMDGFASSPLTLSVFGLLAGYYITYAIGLVHWSRVSATTSRPSAQKNATGN